MQTTQLFYCFVFVSCVWLLSHADYPAVFRVWQLCMVAEPDYPAVYCFVFGSCVWLLSQITKLFYVSCLVVEYGS